MNHNTLPNNDSGAHNPLHPPNESIAVDGAYAALLRASEVARCLAQQTQTQLVISHESKVAQLFGLKRKN
jgi:hypothetical protein